MTDENDKLSSPPEQSSPQPTRAAAAFEVVNLSKSYELEDRTVTVLEDVNFSVAAGEWLTILGPSGCGKTTLLYLLCTIDDPSGGDICCFNTRYSKASARRKSILRRDTIGLVFQDYLLLPELNAWENVQLPALRWGWNRKAVRERAGDLLRMFGLADRLRHRPQELSGGEKQRVAVARALINDPAIILADEPTGNLDADAGNEILNILRNLHKEENKTVIMVTHNETLATFGERTLSIVNGKAQEQS